MMVTLGSLLKKTPKYGINAAAAAHSSSLPAYIRITDIDTDGRFLPNPLVSVDSPLSRNYILQDGDIVIARTGASVGKSYRYRESDGELVFAGFLICITPDEKKLDPVFAGYYLQSKPYWDWIAAESVRSGQPGINAQQLMRLELDLPDIQHQREIGSRLSDVDNLISSLERLISKKQAIKQGMVQQLLSGRTRLPGFGNPWREARLGHMGKTYGGLTGKSKQDFINGNARFVTFMQVMAKDRLTESGQGRVTVRPEERQNSVRKGDILFNGSSETPEEVALAAAVEASPAEETYLNSFCFGFRLNSDAEIDPVYLARYFRSTIGRATVSTLAQGATRYNISKTQLLKVWIELPPLEEQQAISSVISDADDEIETLKRRLESARNIKQGMMQELLSGRTRLSVPEVSS